MESPLPINSKYPDRANNNLSNGRADSFRIRQTNASIAMGHSQNA